MTVMQVFLELLLLGLLAATMFHAVRLERALGVLRRDRTALERLVEGFNDSTRLAEDGAERLRLAAEGAGKQIGRQIERGTPIREDLIFLIERGEKLADNLERLVQRHRQIGSPVAPVGREPVAAPLPELVSALGGDAVTGEAAGAPRSRAERDLLRALRLGT